LNCLVVACVVPAVLVTTFIIYRSFSQERAGFERDLVGTARALNQAVDAELNGARSALLVLAMSPFLASGNLEEFYGEAQRAAHVVNVDTIVLSDVNGQQLINTLQPFGTPLPSHSDREQLRRVIETKQPVISDLFIGAITQKPIISIEAPVLSEGKLRYALAFGFFPERLSEILRRQKMPSDWVAGIVDSRGTIVARTIGGNEFIGKKISSSLRRALQKAGEGAFEGTTLEGVAVLTSFSRSTVSGWAVAIGVPDAIVRKAPSADLWPGQTDEAEAGFSYPELDRLLFWLVDRRRSPEELVAMGFAEAATVLREALRSQDLGANGRIDAPLPRIENGAEFFARVREQPPRVAALRVGDLVPGRPAIPARAPSCQGTQIRQSVGACRIAPALEGSTEANAWHKRRVQR
jgi:hypothetical protein